MNKSQTTSELICLAIACGIGCSVGYLLWTAMSLFRKTVQIPANAPTYELERRSILESTNIVYRNLQVFVYDLAVFNRMVFNSNSLQRLSKSFVAAGDASPWQPEEYISVKQIEGLGAGLVVGAISLTVVSPPIALLLVFAVAGIYQVISITHVHDQAKKRLQAIKMRLPFVVDLMALMIEAGATFRDSLKTVVRENQDHPLGVELARVDRQTELGRPRAEALQSFRERFDDQDITELVFSITKGEELGTPLAKVLRNQADQMRLKRSQWGEKAAAEAQVRMAFPGMIVMFACVLAVVAPIILPAIQALSKL